MLVKCPECSQQLATTAEACPKCGHRPTAQQIEGLVQQKNTAESIAGLIIWLGCGIAWFNYPWWLTGVVFWGPLVLVLVVLIFALIQKPRNPRVPASRQPKSAVLPGPIFGGDRPAQPAVNSPQRPTLGSILARTESGQALAPEESMLVLPIVSAAQRRYQKLQPRQQAFLQGIERSIDRKRAAGVALTDIEVEFDEARHARTHRRHVLALMAVAAVAVGGALTWGYSDDSPSPNERPSAGTQTSVEDSYTVDSMTIRDQRIYIGQSADDVFAFLTAEDMLSQNVVSDPRDATSLVVNKIYKVGEKTFTIEFRRAADEGPYRVSSIKTGAATNVASEDEQTDANGNAEFDSGPSAYANAVPDAGGAEPVDCYALSKYAESQGHGWMEKSLIVGDAEKRGACKW